MGDTVLIEQRGHIAFLTLNRPDRANALNDEMVGDLQARAREAAGKDDVRVIIVTGAGRHFCGGADLRSPLSPRSAAPSPYIALDWVPKPVIAVINGAAMGGGCELALSCDFRLMGSTAKIGLPEIRFGAIPGGGGTARAPRLIGLAAAKRLIMTGEPIDAEHALRIGLVDEITEPETLMNKAIELAETLALRAPYAMRTAKFLLDTSLEVDLNTALELERSMSASMASPEQRKAARDEAAARSSTYANIFAKREPE